MEFQELNLPITDGLLPCIRFGTGEKAFVMIAGMGMTGLAGVGDAVSETYKCFAEEYTVYLFERRSELPDGWTVRDMARDIAEGMRSLGLRNADVMGASQGGMIAQVLAADAPELVHSMVLASSDCFQNEVAQETFRLWITLGEQKDGRAIYRDFFRRVYSVPMPEALAAVENTGTDAQCRRFRIEAEACLGFDFRQELAKIQCPVFVYGSRKDNVLGGDSSEVLADKLGCELHLFEGYGHAVCDEAPETRTLTLDFFRRTWNA